MVSEEGNCILYFFLEELFPLAVGPKERAAFVAFEDVVFHERLDFGHDCVGSLFGVVHVRVRDGDGFNSFRMFT